MEKAAHKAVKAREAAKAREEAWKAEAAARDAAREAEKVEKAAHKAVKAREAAKAREEARKAEAAARNAAREAEKVEKAAVHQAARDAAHEARAAQKAQKAAARDAPGVVGPQLDLTADEAIETAVRECLVLERTINETGFTCVRRKNHKYEAVVHVGGIKVCLGCFVTAEEAALHVARHKAKAAAAGSCSSRKRPAEAPPKSMATISGSEHLVKAPRHE